MKRRSRWNNSLGGAGFFILVAILAMNTATGQGQAGLGNETVKGQPIESLLSSGGLAVLRVKSSDVSIRLSENPDFADPVNGPGPGDAGGPSGGIAGRTNSFVNDPCLDPVPEAPFPSNFFRTVQSETEIAVFNPVGIAGDDSDDRGGELMVAGYNDSYGFYDNRQGLSGFSYSTNRGTTWIDGGGLPPRVASGMPAGTPGTDAYFGDPVVVVDNSPRSFVVNGELTQQPGGVFYYSSLYQNPEGAFTVSVNRGQFMTTAQQVPVESHANTRCEKNPALHTVPDPPPTVSERIIWEPPVEAVVPVVGPDQTPGTDDDDFIDKEWIYVDQATGFLYLTYTRFGANDSTPIEMVRSFDGGRTWTPPSIIVPNLLDTFNSATMPVVTLGGRVIVTWFARTFGLVPPFPEVSQRIEVAYSDDGGNTFGAPVVVAHVNPQGEPLGYNRARYTILNQPYITVDKGRDDGIITVGEQRRSGFGNVYITYFDGVTPLPQTVPPGCNPQQACNPFARAAAIHLSTSTTDGTTWGPEVRVDDDLTPTTHVFPSAQVNEMGEIFVTWIDRRLDPEMNRLNDTWGDVSKSDGASTGGDFRITTVSSDWFTREDARPDYGDYNSSEVINYRDFASIWADGRFPPGSGQITPPPNPPRRRATPDSLFAIIKSMIDSDGK